MIRKIYISLANRSMQETMVNRTSFILNIGASFLIILSSYYLWKAIFAGRDQLGGFSWEEMKAYLIISFLSNTILSYFSEVKISQKILDGSIAFDLLKPIDFQKARLAETVGSSVFEGLVSVVLAFLFLFLYEGVAVPESPITWVFFIISFILYSVYFVFGQRVFWESPWQGLL